MDKSRKQATCIVIGAGQRGKAYSNFARYFPDRLKVLAVADPSDSARENFRKRFALPDDMVSKEWKELASRKKFADFVCVCTPDKFHKEVSLSFIKQGYHIQLEKPMATTDSDCLEIFDACKKHNVLVCVCHVLRYYPPNIKIKELIDSGVIGELVTVQHLEPVGFDHFAHSYVRGNWRNTAESSFSLLAKSCHDIDLICSWIQEKCKSVSSFGSLNHFKSENKPKGAGSRCLDCPVEQSCAYSAVKLYLVPAKAGSFRWPVSVVTDVEDIGVLEEKLRTGPYGRCVYDCDNDVCDNQVVNMEFENGKTASFTMVAFSRKVCCRSTMVYGTKGEITYHGDRTVHHFDFLTRKMTSYDCISKETGAPSGHDGADFALMETFVEAIQTNNYELIKTGIDESLASHRICFAAERSRLEGKTLHLNANGDWK